MRVFSSKRRAGIVGLGIVTGLALSAVVSAAATFGPSRPTFTWANPATYITFNSITDNPDSSIGDERTFISARDAASTDKLTYTKTTPVTDNEEVVVRVFFHNDAAANLNLVAANTKAKVSLPTTPDKNIVVAGHISASNSNPGDVFATMDLTGSQPFTVSYEPGTAQLWTQYVSGVPVNDSIVTTGALIGSGGTDGNVPGCSQFSGFVTLKVRVHVQPSPQVSFACTALNVAQVDRTRFDFTAQASAQNVTIQSYTFTAKDGNGATVDTNTVSTNATSAVYHFNQSNAGTYTVSAVVNTDHGSTNASACSKQITVAAVPTTPTTPTTPAPTKASELPNTGAGDVLGIFAGASAAGTAAHAVVSRRFRR
jgi:hypothetical protein